MVIFRVYVNLPEGKYKYVVIFPMIYAVCMKKVLLSIVPVLKTMNASRTLIGSVDAWYLFTTP